MTDPYWNVENYFLSFPDVPPYEGPSVGMPLQHKIYQVQRFIFENIVRELNSCLKADAELAAITLGLVTVDYLAGYYSGKQATGESFVNFMNDYFPDKYKPYNEFIYSQIRCGLLHNLAAINPWKGEGKSFRIHSKSAPHLEEFVDDEGSICINFSVLVFFEDIKRAFVMYVHDVVMNHNEKPHLEKNFHKRFNKLKGRGAFMIKTND